MLARSKGLRDRLGRKARKATLAQQELKVQQVQPARLVRKGRLEVRDRPGQPGQQAQ